MGAGNRVCIWGEILQEVSRKGAFVEGKRFFLGAKGCGRSDRLRQWTRCCSRMERVLVTGEDWTPDIWVSYLLGLSGAGAGASAV